MLLDEVDELVDEVVDDEEVGVEPPVSLAVKPISTLLVVYMVIAYLKPKPIEGVVNPFESH